MDIKAAGRSDLPITRNRCLAQLIFDFIKQASPNSQVAFLTLIEPITSRYLKKLFAIDIAIGSFGEVPKLYGTELLYTEQHVCLLDESVLDVELPVSPSFVSVEHALVSPEWCPKNGS